MIRFSHLFDMEREALTIVKFAKLFALRKVQAEILFPFGTCLLLGKIESF